MEATGASKPLVSRVLRRYVELGLQAVLPLIVTPGQLTDAERQAVRDQAARINQHARRNGQQGGGAINGV